MAVWAGLSWLSLPIGTSCSCCWLGTLMCLLPVVRSAGVWLWKVAQPCWLILAPCGLSTLAGSFSTAASRIPTAETGPVLKCFSRSCVHHICYCSIDQASYMTKPRVSVKKNYQKATGRHVTGRQEQMGAIAVTNPPKSHPFWG